jgi:hypothetical protein
VQIIIKRRADGPSVPELGTPTSVTFDSVTVPLNRPSTGPAALAAYQIERAANAAGPWTVAATGALIFGNPATQYVDGGRLALTTYFYRAKATDTAGRESAYSAVVSATTPATSSAFAPNRPHLGTGYPGPSVWGNSSNWSKLAQCSSLHFTYYNQAESAAGRSLRSAIDGIKALVPASMGCNPVHATYIVHDEVPNDSTGDSATARLRVKLAAESWYLYASGTSGTPLASSFGPTYYAINRTINAPSSGGKNWIQWYADLMLVQNVTGESGNSANPSLDGMFLDNCYWKPRIDGDYDRNGSLDSASSAAYATATRSGIKAHFDYMRTIWPTARAQLGNLTDTPESDGALYNASYTPNYAGVSPLLGVLDGGLAGEYFLSGASEPFSKEYQERANGLSGFYAARNSLRFVDGLVTNPCLNMWSVRDVTNDGSAADNQRRRFGAAFITTCSDGCIDDRLVLTYSTLPLIYTNGTGVGWLGQPLQSSRYSAYNAQGVYVREFANGYSAVNPRNNGAQTFTVPVATRNVESGATYAANASIPIADRDGVFLVKT